MNFSIIFNLLLLLLYCLLTPIAFAEIYKWQDEEGEWHYSDKPPPDEQQAQVIGKSAAPNRGHSKPGDDLTKALWAKYNPNTPVEIAAISVVAIQTSLGGGSGFFVSKHGDILTNHHVIRPTRFKGWKQQNEAFEKVEAQIEEFEKDLAAESASLQDMKNQLNAYKDNIENANRSTQAKRIAEAEYRVYQERYNRRLREYNERRQYVRKESRKFRQEKAEFERSSRVAKSANVFDIFLKDGSEQRARLIAISPSHDLALLRLEGYTTPWLSAKTGRVPQGSPVYAIGSPIGLRDSVTAGVITRVHSDAVWTDAQILPGNSGGPLLDKQGRVIGVNTAKYAEQVMQEGFGIAIPIGIALQEFRQHLPE